MATEEHRIPAPWDATPPLPPLHPSCPSYPTLIQKIDATNTSILHNSHLNPDININDNNIANTRLRLPRDNPITYPQIDGSDDTPPVPGTPLFPTPAPGSHLTPAPAAPQVLARRYLLTPTADPALFAGLCLATERRVLAKRVCARTGAEVCAQHALLAHSPHVLAPLECVRTGAHSWLVCAPHHGDLHSYVRAQRRVPQDEAPRLFRAAVAAVRDCHARGCVLRDLKLRKFVFADPQRRRLVLESLEDSVVTGEADLLTEKHGCPAYVAPEILHAAAYSGRRADMWSLGVMLYTMLMGRYPFTGTPHDTAKLFCNIRAGRFDVPDWVSSRARHLICWLMQRDPSLRPTADEVLSHPWLVRTPRDLPLRDPSDQRVPTSPAPSRPFLQL